MRKFLIDFIFDERTGESNIIIDFIDESMTALETNEAIQAGEIRDQAAEQAGKLFGTDISRGIRDGKIKLICLDHHPELKRDAPGIALPGEDRQQRKKEIKQ